MALLYDYSKLENVFARGLKLCHVYCVYDAQRRVGLICCDGYGWGLLVSSKQAGRQAGACVLVYLCRWCDKVCEGCGFAHSAIS